MKSLQLALELPETSSVSSAATLTTLEFPLVIPPGTEVTASHQETLARMTPAEREAFRQRQARFYAPISRQASVLDSRWGTQRARRVA